MRGGGLQRKREKAQSVRESMGQCKRKKEKRKEVLFCLVGIQNGSVASSVGAAGEGNR